MPQTDAAKRYAEALAGLIEDPAALERAAQTVRALAEAAVGGPAAARYWRSLGVPRQKKTELLGQLMDAAEADGVVRSFVGVLVANNRVSDLPAIAEALDERVAERLGRTVAHVTSAQTLSDEQQQAIRGRLAEVTGKDVRLETSVDEGLIGGLRVRLGNRILDHSVQGRLRSLVADLAE